MLQNELQQLQQVEQQQPAAKRLNQALQQHLNLEYFKTRPISLFKAISRILEDSDAYARTTINPKWQNILGQYSMVNLELFNIVGEMKKNVIYSMFRNPNCVFNMGGGNPGRYDAVTAASHGHNSSNTFQRVHLVAWHQIVSLQPGRVTLSNTSQAHPNLYQQRQQNPQ